jgi:Recombinase
MSRREHPERCQIHLTAEGRAKGCLASALAGRARAIEAYAGLTPLILELEAGGFSQRRIADRLNAIGHTTRTGKPWGKMQVRRVIDRAKGDG